MGLFNFFGSLPTLMDTVKIKPPADFQNNYSGSSFNSTNQDFLGDWRSVDSWMQLDLGRVRARSRELERGNPWAHSFKIALINNVAGSKGFKLRMDVKTSRAFGDATEDIKDDLASKIICNWRAKFSLARNFTTKKMLNERLLDRLLIARLAFDGEVILRRQRNFPNDTGFAWQTINPDYLDHFRNRIEENGNITRMGVELDKTWKFPVAYWFFKRRPNDYFIVNTNLTNDYYIRVPAEEIIHIYIQDLDDEQTRGFPWMFAAAVNLFRQGKFEEASLINAAIGASKAGFYKKTTPDGFQGDPKTAFGGDTGFLIDEVAPGEWQELPWNVEPVAFDPKYPDSEFGPFCKAMLRGASASVGMSYMTLSNDLSEANFVSMRFGQVGEREQWMSIQEFWIDKWKKPEFEESLYYALLNGTVKLPLAKFDKFNVPQFIGRRWPYVEPVQDVLGRALMVDNLLTSTSTLIEEQGGDPDETYKKIADDQKTWDELGIKRVHGTFQFVPNDVEESPGGAPPVPKPVPAPPPKTNVKKA